MEMKEHLPMGFKYTVEHIRNGEVIDSEVCNNLIPTQGLNHILATELMSGPQITAWYVSIFEGNYTPTAGITAANYNATAGENTTYASATRPLWVGGSIVTGAVDNSLSKADFVMNADKTIYGAAMLSESAKTSAAGTLLSIVRFASSKVLLNGDTLRITAGITLTST